MEAERRQVTVLFTDLVGFTSYSERAGEEAAFTLMQSLSRLMGDAVREQGGVVQGFTGDGIMAVFGAPIAQEDAPLRACRSALAILQRLNAAGSALEAKHGIRPQLRIGLNTGAAVVGQVEGGAEAAVTVLGDTVNFAARLQSLAEPDCAVMSEATFRLVQGMVSASSAGEHAIKGKAEHQRVYRLDSVRQGAARFEAAVSRGLSAFVGRDHELETIQRVLGDRAANMRVVDIAAEPGMGKSRLLYEFHLRTGSNDVVFLSGNCSLDGQQTPFLPFIEVMRGVFRIEYGDADRDLAQKVDGGLSSLGLLSERNRGLLLHLLGGKAPEGALAGLDGVLIGLHTRELLHKMLAASCHVSPAVLLIEDLHWIDSASEQVISELVNSGGALKILVLTTRRPEYNPTWLNHGKVVQIALGALSEDPMRRLIQGRLGANSVPEVLERQVREKAEGNPLFAEEILSFLSERGVISEIDGKLKFDSGAAAAALPGSVQNLLTVRVDRLPADDKALLQAAAVIGRRFDPELVAAVIGQVDMDERLAKLEALDLVGRSESSTEYLFKHALVRDAVYQSLLTEPRKMLHGRIAAEVERRSGNRLMEVAEVLAHHFDQTDSADKAIVYLALAGKKSLGVNSLDEAERYLERALALAEQTPALTDDASFADLLADLTSVYYWKLLPAKTSAVIERYLDRLYDASDLPQSITALSNYVWALVLGLRWREMGRHVEHCLKAAERLGDDRSKASARANWLYAKCLVGESTRQEAEKQIELARIESGHVDEANVHALVMFACAWDLFMRGLTDRGREVAREMQERGRRKGDPGLLSTGLWIAAWFDMIEERYDEMLANADNAKRIALTPWDREMSELLSAMALGFQGKIVESVERLQGVRERCCKVGWTYVTSATDMPLGVAKAFQGDLAGGVQFLETLLKHNQEVGFVVGADMVRLLLAEIYIMLLQSKKLPPMGVLRRNFRFIIATMVSGWDKALNLALAARDNPMFAEVSYWRARTEADLGILYLIKKRYGQAKECLERARPMAALISNDALVAKIDVALAELAPKHGA